MILRLTTLACLLAVTGPATADAQYLSLGLRGGASVSTMSITGVSPEYRTGFLVGPTATLWLSDVVGVQFEALYVRKGFNPPQGTSDTLTLSYVDVPIVALYHLPSVARGMLQGRVQAGPSFGFRVQCDVRGGAATGIATCDPDAVSTFDIGVVGGVGLKIGRGRGGVIIDATYTYGLLNASIAEGSSQTARNRAIMVSAGFLFPIM